ncbi:MAG: glycoside hydrolase family 2 TIM barrel-domain containing protein [Candidatus Sulfopaludibacter sp.]|nr:glycoside hydrolase family 2 TIM barrel-domain containing protein [Candidatus Sulfopaludibacter sp.]
MNKREILSKLTSQALLGAVLLAGARMPADAQARERQLFDQGWRFHLGDVREGQTAAVSDRSWREVDLPHDWSIEGPFSAENASGTGYLPGGVAWYRKTFQAPATMRGMKVSIRFDGVYRDSTVWINGALLGSRPYGYSSFEYDLTPHLRLGGANLLAVRVDRSAVADSRFYTGSGIYRHVWLNVTGPVRIAPWGVYVTTPVAVEKEALVSVETRVLSEGETEGPVTVATAILNERGEEIAATRTEEPMAARHERLFAHQVAVPRPELWSPEHPGLYTAVSRIYVAGKLADEERTRFGIRAFYFSPERGLILNGRAVKIKGVCIHHDLGALGAAFFEEALERRLKSFKQIGVNAIRCSHNPMAPEFYDLCDRLGFLVMDEAFDEWTGGKRKWVSGRNNGTASLRGYHEAFEEWGARDASDMVLRDRNHPSIVLWSIGNEIDYPDDPFTHPRGRGFDPSVPRQSTAKKASLSADLMPAIERRLIAAVKQFDGTRPVTMALADIDASNATGVANLLDVVGYNYLEQFYERDHQAYPGRVIYGSENSRSLDAWRRAATNEFVGGQFLWTGMDFLGEAGRFPNHGSSSGLLDLQGFWKRDAYLRQALWSKQPMVYAAAWSPGADESRMANWQRSLGRVPAAERWGFADDSRKSVPVEIYSNCDSVEALLNGRSLGEKTVSDRFAPVLIWAIPNEPGKVEFIGKKGGASVARFELGSVGQPYRITLSPDLKTLKNGGRQVATIEVAVVDRDGKRVPDATPTVGFEVTGAGRLAGLGNGDLSDGTPATAREIKLYQGRAVAVVRSGAPSGEMTVRATSPALGAAEVAIAVER